MVKIYHTHHDPCRPFENAITFETIRDESGKILLHSQLLLGNGGTRTSPYVSGDVIAHELGHLFTGTHSYLEYYDQSGGINEAFSDITSIAFRDYFQQRYPWFKSNWLIGLSISKAGVPFRYFANPPLDGKSIGHAGQFVKA